MNSPTLPPIRPQKFRAKLSEVHWHNDKFFSLHFELLEPHRIEFRAGQYISIDVPGSDHKKSYSLVSPPEMDHGFELLIDKTPMGVGTRYLMNMQPGDELSFLAPLGFFFLPPNPAEELQEAAITFVATGSGIAPIKGMLEHLLVTNNDQRPITLYWGLRYAEEQFWYDDFQLLAEQHPNFLFHPVLSRPPEEWPLCRGRVTDCLLVHPQIADGPIGYYVCGSTQMVVDVSKILEEKGVEKQFIHHEKFH